MSGCCRVILADAVLFCGVVVHTGPPSVIKSVQWMRNCALQRVLHAKCLHATEGCGSTMLRQPRASCITCEPFNRGRRFQRIASKAFVSLSDVRCAPWIYACGGLAGLRAACQLARVYIPEACCWASSCPSVACASLVAACNDQGHEAHRRVITTQPWFHMQINHGSTCNSASIRAGRNRHPCLVPSPSHTSSRVFLPHAPCVCLPRTCPCQQFAAAIPFTVL